MKNEAQIMQFEKTINNLKEVIDKLKTNALDHAVLRDSAVKRFEISFDVCWKTLKETLRTEYGIEAASPKKVFQEAFKQGLVPNDEVWISMTDMRNETAHAYNEEFSEKVLLELPKITDAFEALVWKLKN